MNEMENTQEVKKSKSFKISRIAIIGLIVGAIGGYVYYWQVGCVSGTCAITSNPWMSTAWGSAFGYLVFDMFSKKNPAS
jgi:xanthine/uracil permease